MKKKRNRLYWVLSLVVVLLAVVAYFMATPFQNRMARQRSPYVVLVSIEPEKLIEQRYQRLMAYGQFTER